MEEGFCDLLLFLYPCRLCVFPHGTLGILREEDGGTGSPKLFHLSALTPSRQLGQLEEPFRGRKKRWKLPEPKAGGRANWLVQPSDACKASAGLLRGNGDPLFLPAAWLCSALQRAAGFLTDRRCKSPRPGKGPPGETWQKFGPPQLPRLRRGRFSKQATRRP